MRSWNTYKLMAGLIAGAIALGLWLFGDSSPGAGLVFYATLLLGLGLLASVAHSALGQQPVQ